MKTSFQKSFLIQHYQVLQEKDSTVNKNGLVYCHTSHRKNLEND